ncbi:hypothetical protein P9578_28380 [Brevibacillus choshinensis]|uniref:glycoside hydrolase family 78 protein n=1 Tax=Brevibacillus choshinensis TaxID=54911 RepID=UPI002E1E012C|nr:hypothetical protein [Brevibacillus choshinensis]
MATVASLDKSELDNTILFVESDNVYINDNGMTKTEFFPLGNKVNFHSKGFAVAWTPSAMKYVDEFGMDDTIYSVQDAPLEVKGNKARFDRSFPDVDDMFIVDGDRLKHTIIVQGWQREPLPWLSGKIDFVISGRLEFDPSLTVHSMGMNLIGPFETGESIEIRNGEEVIFTLPKIVAYDSDIPQRAEAFGRYRVTSNENGSLAFDIVMDNAWMSDPERVYPILIDPTVVVSSAYDTSGNGGRKLTTLSNGWIIAGLYSGTYASGNYFFKSSDNGQTWNQICYVTNSNKGLSLTSKGTSVYAVVVIAASQVNAYKFDATTITNTDIRGTNGTAIDTGQSNLGDATPTTLAINAAGTELHAAWSSKNSTYPNSFNIRYAKGTIDGSGNVTWGSVVQITTFNNTSINAQNPCSVLISSNIPVIVFNLIGSDWTNTGTAYNNISVLKGDTSLETSSFVNASWSKKAIYQGGTYAQSNPCAVVDGNGVIHVVWQGKDSTDSAKFNVFYSKSSDGGLTWTTVVKLSSGNTYDRLHPTISVTNDNKLYVHVHGIIPAVSTTYTNLMVIIYNGTAWSSPISKTSNTTADAKNANAMSKENGYRIGYIYMDGASVKYDEIIFNTPPTAPTNLYPNGISVDRSQNLRFSWQHNDTPGDVQSKYDLRYRMVGNVNWNDVSNVTPNQFFDQPGSSLTKGQYEWQVRTYDQADAVSPYSAQAVFTAGDKPVSPTILEPVATITGPRPNVSWSSADQTAYQVHVVDGVTTVWDTGEVISGNKMVTVGVDLSNNKTYTFKVRIKNADGIWSNWTQSSQSVSFTPPATPVITTSVQAEMVAIQITNPAPTGTQPNAAFNDLYRKESTETVWTRIASDVPVNGSYVDYTPASGVSYDYKAIVTGDNGTIAESASKTASFTLKGVWLHSVMDPVGTIGNYPFDGNGRSSSWQTEVELMKFAGRDKPVAEFGEQEAENINVSIRVTRDELQYRKLMNLIRSREIVCYRDGRGRRVFGVCSGLPVTDETVGYTINLMIDEIDYEEGV